MRVAGFLFSGATARASLRQPAWAARRAQMERSGRFRGVNGRLRTRNRTVNLVGGLMRALLKVTLLHDLSETRAARLGLTRLDVQLPGLPSLFDGYCLLHLSDIHLDESNRALEALHRMLDGMQVDLLVATGDFADRAGRLPEVAAQEMASLAQLLAPRDGVLATLGNHDSWLTAEALEDRGIRVLVNETLVLDREGHQILIAGTDDPSYFFDETAIETLSASGGPQTKIALVHSPELAGVAADNGFSLYLSGHTHGGQIRLPILGAPFNMLQQHRDYVKGAWRHGGMLGYTSSGVGTSLAPLRINCPGEVVLVTLHRA